MTIKRLKDVTENCFRDGNSWTSGFIKTAAVASSAGIWSDLSMAPGNPKPNYYTGTELTATTLDARCGLFTGGNVSPKTKYLQSLTMIANLNAAQPGTMILCDYLLYYPLIDMDSTDEQTFINTVTLPRYTDGEGVMAFLVATNPFTGGAQFLINFTDSDGVQRTTRLHNTNVGANIASVVNCVVTSLPGFGPFINLPKPSKGIRSVQSIQFLSSNGGLASLVLVKPLAYIPINEITATSEFCFLCSKPSLPIIQDGAVLSFLIEPTGSVATFGFKGNITTIFN